MPCSDNVWATSMAASVPSGPSKLPPEGTESTCDPKTMGFDAASRPARRPMMFAAASKRGSSPAVFMSRTT